MSEILFTAYGMNPEQQRLDVGFLGGTGEDWIRKNVPVIDTLFPDSHCLIGMPAGILLIRSLHDKCIVCWQFYSSYSIVRHRPTLRLAILPKSNAQKLIPMVANAFKHTPKEPSSIKELVVCDSEELSGDADDLAWILGFINARFGEKSFTRGELSRFSKVIEPSKAFRIASWIAGIWCQHLSEEASFVIYPSFPKEPEGRQFRPMEWDVRLTTGRPSDDENEPTAAAFDMWDDKIRGATVEQCLNIWSGGRLFERWKELDGNAWDERLFVKMMFIDQSSVTNPEWNWWKSNKRKPWSKDDVQGIFENIRNTKSTKRKRIAPRLLDLHEYGDSSREQKDIIALQFLEFMGLQENIIQQLKNGVSSVV